MWRAVAEPGETKLNARVWHVRTEAQRALALTAAAGWLRAAAHDAIAIHDVCTGDDHVALITEDRALFEPLPNKLAIADAALVVRIVALAALALHHEDIIHGSIDLAHVWLRNGRATLLESDATTWRHVPLSSQTLVISGAPPAPTGVHIDVQGLCNLLLALCQGGPDAWAPLRAKIVRIRSDAHDVDGFIRMLDALVPGKAMAAGSARPALALHEARLVALDGRAFTPAIHDLVASVPASQSSSDIFTQRPLRLNGRLVPAGTHASLVAGTVLEAESRGYVALSTKAPTLVFPPRDDTPTATTNGDAEAAKKPSESGKIAIEPGASDADADTDTDRETKVADWTLVGALPSRDASSRSRVEREGETGILQVWPEALEPDARYRAFHRAILRCQREPCFPAIRDFGVVARDDRRPFVVFEEVDGVSWSELGRSDAVTRCKRAAALLTAVMRVHALFGVIGDLSPRHVVVRDGAVILLDQLRPDLGRTPRPSGAPGYTAPELTAGPSPTVAADQFAVGVMLVEQATGKPLFPKLVPNTRTPAHGYEQPIEKTLINVPDDLRAVCARMLALDPARRYASLADAAHAVEAELVRQQLLAASNAPVDAAKTLQDFESVMPRPMALSARAVRTTHGLEKLHAVFAFTENTLRHVASVALQDWLASGRRDPEVDAWLLAGKFTLGDWLACARKLNKLCSDPFVPELRAFFDNPQPIDALIALRNRTVHPAPVPTPGMVAERLKEAEQELPKLLELLRPLFAYRLVHVVSERTLGVGHVELELRELVGTTDTWARRKVSCGYHVPTDTVALLRPDFSARLLMDPTYIWRVANGGEPDLFTICDVTEDGKIQYTDATARHRIDEHPRVGSRRGRPLGRLLAERDGLGLRGPLGIQPDDAMHYVRTQMARGKVIAKRYLLEEEIGRGAASAVHRARDTLLCDRVVAIKVVSAMACRGDEDALKRLEHQARIMSRLAHPHIVQVLDFVNEASTGHMVMEMVAGGSLESRLRSGIPFTVDEVASIVGQLARALYALHAVGIAHRNLEPAHVLIAADGKVKLGGFNIARELDVELSTTMMFFNRLRYSAPEQMTGAKPGAGADLFALGLLGWDLLKGVLPQHDAGTRSCHLIAAASKERDPVRGPLLCKLAAAVASDPTKRTYPFA